MPFLYVAAESGRRKNTLSHLSLPVSSIDGQQHLRYWFFLMPLSTGPPERTANVLLFFRRKARVRPIAFQADA
jgi:hypothetical protein